MHPHTNKAMETNTNDTEAKHPASAGCHPTTCSACGGAGFTEDFETMTISGVCGECYQPPTEGEGVEIEREECDHWKERAEGLLREWIDTVQMVDAGVYGDMIEETLQFLQNFLTQPRN
jgi:DnaJ-class molecular chaperone